MKVLKLLLKIIGAGILALAILSAVMCIYSLTPVHTPNENKNTDYVWESDSVWMKMTEGISCGRYDSNGYNNLKVVENPDIIILGSSHMEAANVQQKDNVTSLLANKLNGKYSVYNLGISGHDFYKVLNYLETNLELYKPKAVIIETSSVTLNGSDVEDALNHNIGFTQSHNSGIVGALQKIPVCRVVYQQIDGGLLDLFMPARSTHSESNSEESENIKITVDTEPYETVFTYLSELEEKYNTEIIIFYHPFETLNKDGSVSFEGEPYLGVFSEYSEADGISFVDMTPSFEEMYITEHKLPHGFSTGRIGEGHINKYAHEKIAEELCKTISALDKEGALCR